jgi:hypothetical protein
LAHAQDGTLTSVARLIASLNVPSDGWVLAHEGGWDELAMVAAPLVVFGGLLFLANRRANQIRAHKEAAEQPNNV